MHTYRDEDIFCYITREYEGGGHRWARRTINNKKKKVFAGNRDECTVHQVCVQKMMQKCIARGLYWRKVSLLHYQTFNVVVLNPSI